MNLLISLDLEQATDDARDYASVEYLQNKRILPLLTLYNGKKPFVSLQFPVADSEEERRQSLSDASFFVGVFKASACRMIVDSTLSIPNAQGQEEPHDALLALFANEIGCEAKGLPYRMHEMDGTLIWEDRNPLTSNQILDTEPFLVGFLAAQFFFKSNIVPWTSYRKFLESKGFQLIYHTPFTVDNIGFIAKTVV